MGTNPDRVIFTYCSDPHALPDVEVFYRTATACQGDGWNTGEGWYYWACFQARAIRLRRR